MSKAIKLALSIIFLVGLLGVTAMTVGAAAPTGTIEITVFQDDGTTPITDFSSISIAVKNSAGETLDQSLDYLIGSSSNVYKVSYIPNADTYTVTFSRFSTKVSVIVPVKLGSTAKATMKWCSNSVFTAAKSGVIAGNTVDGSGAVLTGVTVKAYGKDSIYETTSAAVTGAYRIFVPAGTYTLVVFGKDTQTDYANIRQTIKVTAGQAAGPLLDSNGQTAWGSMSYTSALGLAGLTISGTSQYVTGTAAKNTTVSVYDYDIYVEGVLDRPIENIFLGSQKVTAKGTDATGTFKIKIPVFPAGRKIVVIVSDASMNTYEDTTYKSSAVSNLTATLTTDTKATIITPVNIAIVEPTGVTVGNLNSSITAVEVTQGQTTDTLDASDYSLVTKGKIIIKQGVLPTAGTYTITVTAKGYNELTVSQVVGISTTAAPTTLTGTFTVKTGGGTASGSAQFSSIGTAGSGNSLVYVVSNLSAIQVKLGNTLTGSTTLAATTDITGVALASKKYIHVYEIDGNNAVVKAKSFTLTAAQIKA